MTKYIFNCIVNSADLKDDDPILSGSSNMTLRINSSGQVLHAYVNGNYVGNGP